MRFEKHGLFTVRRFIESNETHQRHRQWPQTKTEGSPDHESLPLVYSAAANPLKKTHRERFKWISWSWHNFYHLYDLIKSKISRGFELSRPVTHGDIGRTFCEYLKDSYLWAVRIDIFILMTNRIRINKDSAITFWWNCSLLIFVTSVFTVGVGITTGPTKRCYFNTSITIRYYHHHLMFSIAIFYTVIYFSFFCLLTANQVVKVTFGQHFCLKQQNSVNSSHFRNLYCCKKEQLQANRLTSTAINVPSW